MGLISSYKKKIRKYYGFKTIVKQGFWFVDVPRTSSTSIRVELTKHFGLTNGKKHVIEQEHKVKKIFKSHMTDQTMQELLGSKNWNDLFTFSFVRNPWDPIYSMFCYRQKTNIIPDSWTFEDYILQLEGATTETEYFQHHVFRFGASDYIYDEDGNCMVDLVAKFEQRQEGI